MRLTPPRRLYFLGAVILVSMAICSRNFGSLGAPSFLIPLGVAGVAYLLAFRQFLLTPRFPKHVLIAGLVLAGLCQMLFLRQSPGSDDDIRRYVWDGRVQRMGYNPYVVTASDPALSSLHTAETRTLNHPDLPSPYPPGAELFFRVIMAIDESVFALKVAFVLCAWVIVLILMDVSRQSGQGAHLALAYAWHPLLAIDVAGSGHVDILGALLLVVSFAALLRRWRTIAAVAFALAVAVKLLPVVLLPLYWKRIRVPEAVVAVMVFALLYIPFLSHGRIPFGSLGTFVHSFRFNDPVFAMLESVAAPEFAAVLVVLIGCLTAVRMRTKSPALSEAFAWPMAASLLCAPVVYPWYLLWLLPFLRSASTLPIVVWTISIVPTYYVWHLRALGHPWIVPGWVLLVQYGAIAMAAVILWLGRAGEVEPRDPLPH